MVEFEHTIFILLLLTSVLNAKPPQPKIALFIILIGVLLVFIPPAFTIILPWELILGIAIPFLLWQNIRRIVNAEWRGWNSVALWVLTGIIFSIALWLGGALKLPSALLFGIVAASMIWRASEPESSSSYMSLVGPLTLVFLLTEVEVAIQSPNHYIGGIFSGAFFGIVTALFGIYLVRRTPAKYQSWIGIGQAYLAYLISDLGEVSAVTAALVSIMVFVWLNQYFQLGYHKDPPLAPLNTWPGFSIILALFLLLGWQGHQPVTLLLIIEVVLGAILSLGITWLGCRLELPAFQKQSSFWMASLRAALLLFPALLLWPRDALQQPLHLLVAISISILVIGISYLGLLFYFPKTQVI